MTKTKPTQSRPGSAAPAPRRRSILWRFRRLLFLAGLLVVFAVAGVGYVLAQVEMPQAAFQPETTFVYDAAGNVLAEFHGGEDRVEVELDEVPPVLVDAVLATEDRDFFNHQGVDAAAIVRAAWADIRAGGAAQGGSTITQQYVKNVYVGRERSLFRKIKEAVIAVKIEREEDKNTILERYLNSIYFGRGAYGVEAASRSYFGKPVGQIELREAAYLAGLIRAPEAADVTRKPEEANRRRDLTLQAMVRDDRITEAEADAARSEPVEAYTRTRPDEREEVVYGREAGTTYFVDFVRAKLIERYGEARVYGGGLRVHTTLDPAMQAAAYDVVYNQTLNQPDDPAGALVSVDDGGQVRAMVGGRNDGSSKVNLAVGSAGGGTGRQAGSAFKPFVLAEAVRQGISVESSFESRRQIIFPKANAGEDWKVTNYGGASHGPQNLIDATRVSSNTVYAQLIQKVGPQNVADLSRRMGISAEVPAVVSLTLGTATVSPLDMAAAYLTLATRGTRVDPVVINRVTDADLNLVDEFPAGREQVLDPEQADVVTFCLRQVVERGTGTGADPGVPVAGKTGTTQKNGDAWFVGYTPRLSTSVWMGYPEGQARPMDRVHGREVTGGTFPASIFRQYMRRVPEQYKGGRFPEPESFRGTVLNSRLPYADPDAPTTTTSTSTTTTSTTAPAETTTSTTAPGATTTTAPGATTTTKPPQPGSTTTTTAPPQTTTTAAPPPAAGPPGQGGGIRDDPGDG